MPETPSTQPSPVAGTSTAVSYTRPQPVQAQPVSPPAVAPTSPSANSSVPLPLAPDSPEPEQPEKTKISDLNLHPTVLGFLLSSRYEASQAGIKKDFSLTDDDVLLISDLDRLAMGGKLTLEQYLLALEDELVKLPEKDRDRLYGRLLAERFVPLGDRLKPSAVEIARAESITLPRVAYHKLYDKPLTYSGVATEIATAAGFALMGGPVRERVRDLVMSKLKGIRTDAQIHEALMRGIDVGGVGLDTHAADLVTTALNDILSRATVMSEDEYANWLADQARPKPQPVTPSVTESEDPEIVAIQAKMAAQSQVPATQLDKAVMATVGRLNYTAPDDYLGKRLRNVISSRLRDVRNSLELKQLLMRDTKVGGLGLKADQSDALAKQIEEAYAEFHGVIAQEEKGKIEQQLEEQKRKVEERRKHEAEEHARWFEEKIRARKTGEAQQSQALENMRRVMGGQTTPIQMPTQHPVDAKEQRMETAKFGPLVPVANGAGASKEKPQAPVARPASPSAPKPTELKVSPATIKLAQAASLSRPSLDGMSYAGPQLVGLVGELKRLTVAEFRRISKNPQDAATKIRQKIETLGQESFDKRVEGIRAFQESPLQGAYMALVGESFKQMRAVATIAEEKRNAGGDSLSSDEIAAIMALNSGLHF